MIPALILIFVAVVYRVVFGIYGVSHAWMPNFSPVAAIALCGGLLFPKRLSLIVPLAILFVSDVILNVHFGVALVTWEMAIRYFVLFGIACLGLRLATSKNVLWFLGGSIVASLAFYLVTNTVSWFTAPEYAKTFAGWIQALTTGVPGYPPTWLFFRNSLLSDLIFTIVFLATCWSSERRQGREHAAELHHAA